MDGSSCKEPRRRGRPRLDLTDKRFGLLTVLALDRVVVRASGSRSTYWRCVCDCGNEKIVSVANLQFGGERTCGRRCIFRHKILRSRSRRRGTRRVWDPRNRKRAAELLQGLLNRAEGTQPTSK